MPHTNMRDPMHRPRFLSVALALVTAFALVACDPDPATTEPGAAPPTTTDPATPAAPAAPTAPADPTAPAAPAGP